MLCVCGGRFIDKITNHTPDNHHTNEPFFFSSFSSLWQGGMLTMEDLTSHMSLWVDEPISTTYGPVRCVFA